MVSVGRVREPSKLFQPKRNKSLLFFDFPGYLLANTRFFLYKKIFYQKMSLKNPKTLRKCSENLQPQMLKLLITLIFPRAFQMLQNCE